MNKLIKILLIFFLLLILFPTQVVAHPGNTDSSGGHTCRTNCPKWGYSYGEYHYHGGYTAPEPTPIITYEYEYESQEIPFKTSKVDDSTLLRGETLIKQVGVPGTKRITYKVTYEDFVEKSRKKYSEEVITAPTNEIISIGTKAPSNDVAESEEGSVAGATDQQSFGADWLFVVLIFVGGPIAYLIYRANKKKEPTETENS